VSHNRSTKASCTQSHIIHNSLTTVNETNSFTMRFSSVILAVLFPLGNSFVFEKTLPPLAPGIKQIIVKSPDPPLSLQELVDAQSDQRVSVGLDIGRPGDTSRLAVNGIVFDLTKQTPSFKNDFVKMPGLHGPTPSLSGGINTLATVQDGSFISMAGSETVKPLSGCWEIIWRDGAPCGSLICGFEIDQDYKRNDATLPMGTVYVSFNMWTSEGLKQAQDYKDRSSKKANSAQQKRIEEIEKMRETTNVLEKARHYYNALSAAEEYTKQPISKINLVPSSDEVLHFEGNMQVSTKGTVWTQNLPDGKPITLGSARMQSVSKEI